MTNRHKRLLIISPPYSYRIAAFLQAARRMNIHADIASAGEHSIVSVIHGGIHIDYSNTGTALLTLMEVVRKNGGYDGIIGTDDNTVVLASLLSEQLGLPGNPPDAALKTRRKDIARQTLQEHGCAVPEFRVLTLDRPLRPQIAGFTFPAVIKPVSMAASRGVMRVDDPHQLEKAVSRLKSILEDSESPEDSNTALLEAFMPGHEVAYEGLLSGGKLQTIAVFDKPDALDGPFFEESYYITPSRYPELLQKNCAALSSRPAPPTAWWKARYMPNCVSTEKTSVLLKSLPAPSAASAANPSAMAGNTIWKTWLSPTPPA